MGCCTVVSRTRARRHRASASAIRAMERPVVRSMHATTGPAVRRSRTPGDGAVSIGATGSPRSLRFGADIFPRDLALRRDGRDVLIALADGTATWRIAEWFDVTGGTTIGSIRFDDTGYWDVAQVTSNLLVVEGGDGADTLTSVENAISRQNQGFQ